MIDSVLHVLLYLKLQRYCKFNLSIQTPFEFMLFRASHHWICRYFYYIIAGRHDVHLPLCIWWKHTQIVQDTFRYHSSGAFNNLITPLVLCSGLCCSFELICLRCFKTTHPRKERVVCSVAHNNQKHSLHSIHFRHYDPFLFMIKSHSVDSY